jgi:hypothetical protein
MRLLALLYYRESLHFIQPFSLTFAALPFVLFKSGGAQENHEAAHAPDCSIDRELPSIDLNVAPKIEEPG